jgi:hypothetical protein
VTIQLSGKMSSGEVVAALLSSAMIVIHLHYIAAAGCWDFVAQQSWLDLGHQCELGAVVGRHRLTYVASVLGDLVVGRL